MLSKRQWVPGETKTGAVTAVEGDSLTPSHMPIHLLQNDSWFLRSHVHVSRQPRGQRRDRDKELDFPQVWGEASLSVPGPQTPGGERAWRRTQSLPGGGGEQASCQHEDWLPFPPGDRKAGQSAVRSHCPPPDGNDIPVPTGHFRIRLLKCFVTSSTPSFPGWLTDF